MRLRAICKTRTAGYPLLTLVAGISVLLLATAMTPVASAQTGRPGETDPALTYTEWRDDEIFAALPVVQEDRCPAGGLWGYVASSGLDDMGVTREDCLTWRHDAIGAAAGRILTPDRDAVIYAYRGGNWPDLEVSFADPVTAPVATLPNLGPRAAPGGSTDLFDLAAADLDGMLTADDEYRDEVVVAYAQWDAYYNLPVQVAVLSFDNASEADPAPTAITTAAGSARISAGRVFAGPLTGGDWIAARDTMIAVATGDFDGDHVHEIAVGYLSGIQTLKVEIFRYRVTVADDGTEQRSLTRVASLDTNAPVGHYWVATLSLAAGDFDGDGRDELAAGTVEHHGTEPDVWQDVRVKLFRATATTTDLTLALASDTLVHTSLNRVEGERVQLAAGLFKVDVPNGWDLHRRQLAVAFDAGSEVWVMIDQIQADLTQSLSNWASAPRSYSYANSKFWIAAGGFQGNLDRDNPTESLAMLTWGDYTPEYYLFKVSDGVPARTFRWTFRSTAWPPSVESRMPLLAHDTDGDTVYLGAPLHITVEELWNTDFIIEEPPKHAYWDPVAKKVVNVSRFDDFAVSLYSSTAQEFSSTSKDTSDYSVGASAALSASRTVDRVGLKHSREKTTQVALKAGFDFETSKSDYDSFYADREAFLSGRTDRDDWVASRTRTIDIWRYRVFGLTAEAAADGTPLWPFFDIVLPVPAPKTEYGAGTALDWYEPIHENGNILSYPQYDPAFTSPPDLGSFTIPCPDPDGQDCENGLKTVTALMLDSKMFWDGTSNLPNGQGLSFSVESGEGQARSYKYKLTENASLKHSTKTTRTTARISELGSNVTRSWSAEFELHANQSWSSIDTSDAKTRESTGITLYKRAGANYQGYAFYPVIYTALDGTIKVTHAVDLGAHEVGKEFWIDQYGQKPDLALNLPSRFLCTQRPEDTVPTWWPLTTNTRKQMRGLFLSKNAINEVTGDYPPLNGAVVDGEQIRVEARVYNYSVNKPVPAGAKICFEVALYDQDNNIETEPRKPIPNGCTLLPLMAPQEMVTASIVWDTARYSGYDQDTELRYPLTYRLYVVLDPPDAQHPNGLVDEKYETETAATQTYCVPDPSDEKKQICVDPGQNNEGYYSDYITVVPPATQGDPRWGKPHAHVSMPKDAVSAINPRGKLVSGNVQAYLGQPLQVRVTINSDTTGTDYSNVLVYDGDPDQGGKLIAGKRVFSGDDGPEGSSVWLEWVPQEKGPHRLFAKVLQSVNDPTPGDNTGVLKVEVIPVPPGLTR